MAEDYQDLRPLEELGYLVSTGFLLNSGFQNF